MKSIKHRLLSLLLTLVTILSLLPTAAFAASNTGSGLKITTNQAYWSTRLLANGTPYSYRPPLVDGKLVYCMDSGLGYHYATASYLNSFTWTSGTGADADTVLQSALTNSGLSEMDAATVENVKWMMTYLNDCKESNVGQLFMAVQTYVWDHQSYKGEPGGDGDAGGYAAMTSMDEMDFGSLGERKRAIFCVIPVNDSSMNYLVGMLYTQCFQELYRRADLKYNGRLPVPVRVLQDEWANVAQPESYPKILATCRSYNIGLNIIVQNIQQIKALYEKEWESIIGNCDTLLFLGGGNEPTSLEFIVKLLGKETIATRTRGQTKGRSGSSSTNFQQTGRDLMTIDEVRKLDTHKAILFIRGEDPVLDKKYNIKRHPNIKLTTDGKAKPYIHKPLGAPDYALPDLPYAFKSLDDYDFIDVEEPEHELSEKEKDFKPDKTE